MGDNRVFWLWTGIVMSSAVSVSMYVTDQQDTRSAVKPVTIIHAPPVDTRTVRIDPAATRCTAQPFGTKQDGWGRLRTQDEAYVDALVKRGLAEKSFPQTTLCRDATQKPLVEFSLRETWWRRLPRPQQYQSQACGDYTRPEVPNPVVVGV